MSDNDKILHSGPEYPQSQNYQSPSQPHSQPQVQPQYQYQYQQQQPLPTGSGTLISSPSIASTSTPQLQHQPSSIISGAPDGSDAQFIYPQVTSSEAQYQYPQVTAARETELPEVSRAYTSPPPNQNQFIHPQQQQRQFTNPQAMSQPQLQPTAYGQQGGEWQASLCNCAPCSSCLLGWCLPCICALPLTFYLPLSSRDSSVYMLLMRRDREDHEFANMRTI